jgi:hypothetical protein
MIEEIDRFFPLIDGEHVEEDIASYLENDWAGFPSGAVVLKRLTNRAVTYYVYPNIRADVGKGELVEYALSRSNRALLISADSFMAEPDFGGAAKTLANGLAGLAPPPFNVLGSALITAFWPSSSKAEDNWQQVYNALQQIVKNGLAANNVQQSSQKLQGFVSFLNNEYKPLKENSQTPKQKLLDALLPYDTAFFLDIVNVFMDTNTSDEGIAAASLANFMTGACLHMALNQERALVDPEVSTPSSSPYAKTVSNLANTYATYARKTAPYVKQLRLTQISSVQSDSHTQCSGISTQCTTIYDFWFTDSNNGYRSNDYSYNGHEKHPPDAKGDAQNARTNYYNNISSQMDTELQDQVFNVASTWDKLVSDPVPNPSS